MINGKGFPMPIDELKLEEAIERAHKEIIALPAGWKVTLLPPLLVICPAVERHAAMAGVSSDQLREKGYMRIEHFKCVKYPAPKSMTDVCDVFF